jgi:arylsulfatase A-like enzyme
VNVPFYVRGPGVPAGAVAEGMVSLMDVGATVMELAGAAPPGARTTDGRSIVPLLGAGGPPPAGWRNGVLIEHMGEKNQWMSICGWVFNATSCPAKPDPAKDPYYLIDGPQNTWAQWRVVNATHDFSYTEFRDVTMPPARSATNWTELYNTRADPWQGSNLASAPVAAYADELWRYAACEAGGCP